MKKKQPYARLAAVNGELLLDDLRKSQSTSGLCSSQRTLPADSRSILIANHSAQDRDLYATFFKWPAVVPHRSAKASRSVIDIGSRKVSRSMSEYHHMVNNKATPIREFTNWCLSSHNGRMNKAERRATRVANTLALIRRDFHGVQAELARKLDLESGSYLSDLLRAGSKKSFGEDAARSIEEGAGLQHGQLDIKDSPLLRDNTRKLNTKDEIQNELMDLSPGEEIEIAKALAEIKARRKRRRQRASTA